MQLSLQLYLHASFGCRGVSWVLRLLTGYLPLGVPAASTVLNWCCRLGLAVLQRALPRRDDWIFIIDHKVALGALNCLVVLGIPASRLTETGYSPRHCDMTMLAVEVTANSTGVWVAAVLEQVATRTGVPVQIVADHGSDLRKGIALFRQQAPRCAATYDISHAVAAQLQAELAAQGPLAAPVADFQRRLVQHVEQEAAKLPADATWLAFSDVIESVFGHYKTFTARGPLKEVGRLVLLIPAFLSELSAPLIREAMASVRTIDVQQWVDTHLGVSMLARRRRALKPDMKTA